MGRSDPRLVNLSVADPNLGMDFSTQMVMKKPPVYLLKWPFKGGDIKASLITEPKAPQ